MKERVLVYFLLTKTKGFSFSPRPPVSQNRAISFHVLQKFDVLLFLDAFGAPFGRLGPALGLLGTALVVPG
jgi:hypothetical protein